MKRKESYLLRLLEDEINGFKYGNYLLTDPKNNKEAEFLKINNLPNEPNTEDEELFKLRLVDWLKTEEFPPLLADALKKIAPLKFKFPEILDPRRSKGVTQGDLKRLTFLPYRELKKVDWIIDKVSTFGPYALTGEYNWKPRSNRGVTSFTWKESVVGTFYDAYLDQGKGIQGKEIKTLVNSGKEDFNVLVIMSVSNRDKNLLVNPDYLHLIHPDLDEGEVFYLYEESIPVEVTIPSLYEREAEEILTYLG